MQATILRDFGTNWVEKVKVYNRDQHSGPRSSALLTDEQFNKRPFHVYVTLGDERAMHPIIDVLLIVTKISDIVSRYIIICTSKHM